MENIQFGTEVVGRANGEGIPHGVGIYDPQKQGPIRGQTFMKIR